MQQRQMMDLAGTAWPLDETPAVVVVEDDDGQFYIEIADERDGLVYCALQVPSRHVAEQLETRLALAFSTALHPQTHGQEPTDDEEAHNDDGRARAARSAG